MTDTVRCACGKVLEINDAQSSEFGQCPACGNQFIIGGRVGNTGIQEKIDVLPKKKADSYPQYPSIPNFEKPWIIAPGVWSALIAISGFILLALVGAYFSFGPTGGGENQITIARVVVQGPLTQACQQYRMKHDHFPKNLGALLMKDEVGGPYLESPDALIDPWGNPYQYDPQGPRNNGRRPDIWTVSPNGGVEIGNWPKGR